MQNFQIKRGRGIHPCLADADAKPKRRDADEQHHEKQHFYRGQPH